MLLDFLKPCINSNFKAWKSRLRFQYELERFMELNIWRLKEHYVYVYSYFNYSKVVPKTREKVEYEREGLSEKTSFIPEYVTIHRFSTKFKIRSCFLLNTNRDYVIHQLLVLRQESNLRLCDAGAWCTALTTKLRR